MASRFMKVEEVAEQLQIAKSTAYALIQTWNQELDEMGYYTKAGSIPRKYFEKKCYGYDEQQT